MIITLTGSNSYGLKQRLARLVSQFAAEHGDLALERLDATEVELPVILEAVQSQPFLAAKKMVVLRGLANNKAAVDGIEQLISSISDNTDLVIVEPAIDRRTALFKVLKAQTQFEEFTELDGPALAKWLAEAAKKQGGQLSLADAKYLVERVGANQQRLVQELDKLITYNPEINRQTIDLLSEPTPQSRVFDLLDAAFNNQKKRALELYEDQRAQQVEPQAILAMLAWQLRLISYAKLAGSRSASELAKETGMSEYPVRKAMGLTRDISNSKLLELVNDALTVDRRAKTSNLDLDEALKTYIISL